MKYFCPKCDRRSDEDGICPDDGCDFLPYDDRDPFVGRVIDERFEVRAKLGEGGMGAVYMAHQRSVDRPVVLKVLRRELQDHPSVVRRFLLEAKAASRLTNAHTITIFDFGKTRDGVLYIAMEYLEGRSLSEKLKDQGSLSVEETVRILDKVAESLAEAHAQGIIHRDIKPDNVFLAVRPEDPEFVKVLDFGIARATSLAGEQAITRTGTIQGTPTYVSPEAVVGEKVDERADVYALGVMMYEMLTGQPPYTAETTMSLLMQHVNSEPAPLEEVNPEVEVPWPIEELIWSCLAKSRDRRPPDARGFRMALIEAMSQADDPDTEMKIPIQETGEGFKVSEEELTMITTQEREIPRSLTPSGAVARSTPGAATPAVIVEAAPVSPWPWIMLAGGALIVLSVVAWWVLSVRGGERQRSTAAEVSAQASPSALADVTDDAPLITRTARPDLPRDGTEVAGAPGADQRGPGSGPADITTTAPAESLFVTLSISSKPPGARVIVGGDEKGTTPWVARWPRGDAPLAMELRRAGYEIRRFELTPDEDGKVEEILRRARPARRPRPSNTPKAARTNRTLAPASPAPKASPAAPPRAPAKARAKAKAKDKAREKMNLLP